MYCTRRLNRTIATLFAFSWVLSDGWITSWEVYGAETPARPNVIVIMTDDKY
jgi:hypothetical protein